MGATRPASGKDAAIIQCIFPFNYPDARRVAPISACVFYSVWCLRLVVAFCVCVQWQRLEVAFSSSDTFTILPKLYLPSILHLTLTRHNLLIVNTLLSVRCYKFHLHTTYTTLTLPHGTSTGEQYHGIGEQNSLLLRQIFLLPYAVLSTAYDKTDCAAAG